MNIYIELFLALYAAANIVTRLTPNKNDDAEMSRFNRFWRILFEVTRRK